ncbi:MAG: DUF885 domain-containing protein, partial [Bifidobacteriaceae bacterium]|nr:DUF885 domain-containing protein [Bifidobacteriaceae bacterium]
MTDSLRHTPRLSAVDTLAERYAVDLCQLSPMTATAAGIAGYDTELDDLSPDGHAARADLARTTLRALAATPPANAQDRITLAAMTERLGLEIERFDAGEHLRDLNGVASPVQTVREVFDLMGRDGAEAWDGIVQRLTGVSAALVSYQTSLRQGAHQSLTPAIRQVKAAVRQAERLAAPGSFFDELAAEGGALPSQSAALGSALAAAATQARAAYGQLAGFLTEEIAPLAPLDDAVGRDRYRLASRYFLGAAVDLDETYQWGLAELSHVVADMEAVAAQLGGPGTSIERAV